MVAVPSKAAGAGRLAIGGQSVNRLGFGAMRLTGAGIWGDPPDPELALRVLRRAVALGVDFIDTADSYGPEVSERLIARALHPYPAGLVIATKGGLLRPGPDVWTRSASPEHLRQACEASLARLKCERIELYQLHAPDPRVPLADSVGALVRLQREGKIRHIGLCNVSVDELTLASGIATIVSVQNRYNLEDRRSDPVIEWCERHGAAFVPWAPLAAGAQAQGQGGAAALPSNLARVAARHGIRPSQAALAWLLARSPAMLPIPGTSSLQHLDENVAASTVRLTPEDLRELA